MKISISGASELGKALRKKAEMKDVKLIVKSNGSEMTKNAQRLAPVDTGALKNSITLDYKELESTTGVGVHYGGYVNNGTRFMSANPYLTNAYELQKSMFIRELEALVK
ncbi:HK97-gp10 family putative phage morphogenesis protein [Ignavigranum ruoffiae]|uniref:HK97-gp10 family putative phage morphogenesis protein n=1 Tax=Ignavigranum ruoffiae TaxID=89093 RepID=UPI0023535B30|nr:HK97-gp10 family putative phage morphogenesis protein [Ignavigranum ruoffiae]